MSDLAIQAHGLGKMYQRGSILAGQNSLRDVLSQATRAMFQRGERPKRESFWALKDVSFEIGRGENVGIIGLNGAGKSTLLKVLSRIVTPTTGTARLSGRMGALLEVGTGFHQELTGRENAFLYGAILGMSREEVARKFDAIVDFAEIAEFIDTPVKRYSSGMYVRLAFAVAAHLDPDILLLDEVLAVGDFTFQRKCMAFARQLEQKGSTILFVSHNMFSIKSMCPRVIYLKRGQMVYDGPTDEGLKLYEADSRLAPAPWFHNDDKAPPAIVITDVKISGEDGVEKTVFDFGERMRVRIDYEAFRPIKAPDFRIGINRTDDVHCCTFSSVADEVDVGVLDPGTGTIEVTTSPLNLVSELYQAFVSVRENKYGHILCAQIGGHFHVRHPTFASNAFGIFHQPGDWRMKDAVPAGGQQAG
jgi:lipopolysaccharide transport system ATP-binding protein